MTGRTATYYIAAPDAMEAIRTAWDSGARGLAMLGAEPDDGWPPRRRGQHVYKVRVPLPADDGRQALLGVAEEVAE